MYELTARPHSDAAAAPEVSGTAGASPPVKVRLRIMATSDLHMHLAAYDYYTDQPCPYKGLALTATLIAQARAEAPGALLFDNGDFLQGSPLGDFVSQTGHQPNPCIAAMNHLGYDAVNLGNHEFSFGMDYLRACLAEAVFPCLSANTHGRSSTGGLTRFLPPSVLLTRNLTDSTGQRHLLRVGVIGVLPPQTAIWDRQAIGGRVILTDMVEAVALHAPRLRAEGADVVIVLAHSGVGPRFTVPMAENAALSIAALPGVDAIVMGHVHLPFPGPETPCASGVDPMAGMLAGKPAVMPGVYGSHLGVIDLDLARAPTGMHWTVVGHRSEARPVALRSASGAQRPQIEPDTELSALIAPAHRAALDWARRPIGRTPRAIHSYFAMVADCSALTLVNRAQVRYVASRLQGGQDEGMPILSATAPFKAGGRAGPGNYSFIPPGDLLLRHAADLYVHPNTIVALQITGADVRHWLERAVQVFNPLTPGQPDQMLLNPDVASFNFDRISGVTYRIDLATPPGQGARIRDLCWQGTGVCDEDAFILATNSYRSSGSGGFLEVPDARVVFADQTSNRDILISYLADGAHLNDAALYADAPAWSFAPCPGTSALFDSAPESLAYVDEVAHLSLTPLTLTAQGFQRYRLSF